MNLIGSGTDRQQLLTARHLLTRSLGICEFLSEKYSDNRVFSELAAEIRLFLEDDQPTLTSEPPPKSNPKGENLLSS